MSKNTKLANVAVNTEANALAELMNGGFMDVLDGPMPAAADLPITSQTVGITLGFADPAFRPAVAGIIVSNELQPGVAVASITPSWARIYEADHKTVVMDISAGAEDANFIIPVARLEQGMTVCGVYTHTIPKWSPGS